MVDLLILGHPHVGGARTLNLHQGDVVDLVGLLQGLLHIPVEPCSVLDYVWAFVPIEVKLLFHLGDMETTIVHPFSKISLYLGGIDIKNMFQ